MSKLTNPNRRRAFGAGAAVLASAATLAPQVHAQQVTRLKIQTAVPSSSIYFDLLKRMGDRVDRMSSGRLKLEMLPDGAVVPAFEIFDAVDKGVVDGGYAWTHYWSGKNTAAGLFSNPAAGGGTGMDQLSHVAWLFQGDGNALYKKFFSEVLKVNIEPFMVQPMGPDPLGWFKNPIASLDDFRKVKYRSPPGLVGEIFKEMGVSAVAMPGGEIVPAAQRGVIDAAEWIGPADDAALGLNTVWKNYYLQGLHQAIDIGDIYVNLDWWNKLPKDLQAMFQAGIMALITDTYNWNVSQNSKALKKFVVDDKVQVRDTPPDVFPAYMAASKEVLEKYAKQDPFFAKVYKSMIDWANLTVPYTSQTNGLFYNMGKSAMDKKLVGYDK